MPMRTPLSVFCVVLMTLGLGCATNQVDVKQYGKMHAVLSGGGDNAVGVVNVGEVLDRPNAIAVGALKGLEGEITICNGRAWIARPGDGALRVASPAPTTDEQAALMTVAYVDDWQEFPCDRDLAGESLEAFIAAQAKASGIDVQKPFPFMLEGPVTDLQLHVINGECPMRVGAKLGADQQPWRKTFEHVATARVVGFYATDSVGKMTHPGTSIHAHALMQDAGRYVTGHIERIALGSGGVLKLPRTQ